MGPNSSEQRGGVKRNSLCFLRQVKSRVPLQLSIYTFVSFIFHFNCVWLLHLRQHKFLCNLLILILRCDTQYCKILHQLGAISYQARTPKKRIRVMVAVNRFLCQMHCISWYSLSSLQKVHENHWCCDDWEYFRPIIPARCWPDLRMQFSCSRSCTIWALVLLTWCGESLCTELLL